MRPRQAGVMVPLFSARSTASWGIGELADVVPLSRWLASAGFHRLMLLPLGTMQDGETSPYSAASTMAFDPIYIAPHAVSDFGRAGGVAAMSPEGRRALDEARGSPIVRYDAVRRAKDEALVMAFGAFFRDEWEEGTPRAAALAAYAARERWWLDDYALFQTLVRSMPDRSWRDWSADLRDRDPIALADARREHAAELLREHYWQWIAEEQWRTGRTMARRAGVAVIGDLPFVPALESAEVWARAGEFLLDATVGTPPDAFSDTGQDWGLPAYDWEVIARGGYAAIAVRARRMAALYDGLRVDHAIGLYRTYDRRPDGEAFFSPADEPAQIAQGETVFAVLRSSGLDLVAEDLGTLPEFLRPSLEALGIPGCKVVRWERDWRRDGQPFLDPRSYAPLSAAMTGTHDTDPMALWWERLSAEDRAAVVALPLIRERGLSDCDQPWTAVLRDAFVELAYGSGSQDLFLPIQDLFGWRDVINTPGTIGSENWTWCLPWPVDELERIGEAIDRAAFLRRLAVRTGRASLSEYTKGPPIEGAQPE